MKGVVWGYTLYAARNKLEEIEQEYEIYHKATPMRKIVNSHETLIEYDNGDCWRALRATESARGIRCNISYIDTRIDIDIVNTIIKPVTSCPPYHAFQYFSR